MDTLAEPSRFELEVKKSRFYAQAFHVTDPQAALAQVEQMQERDARHNCYAYRIGQQYRFYDADEPSGTAGKPILSAIDGQLLDQVVVLVSRWFGGIKLGTGGLIRAYGGAAAQCLRLGTRTPIRHYAQLQVQCSYADQAQVLRAATQLGAVKLEESHLDQGLVLQLQVEVAQLDELTLRIRDASRGRARTAKL